MAHRPVIHFFTKRECSLCVPVLETIRRVAGRKDVRIVTVDIEQAPEETFSFPVNEQFKREAVREAALFEKSSGQQTARNAWFLDAFRYHIPVVTVNGAEIFRASGAPLGTSKELSESALEAALSAADA